MNTANNFDFQEYERQQRVFPQITFDQFQSSNDEIMRDSILEKNRIVCTDTYNRTMNHIKGKEDSEKEETFSLSFRRTWEKNYNIVYGVKRMVRELLELPLTQNELDFAADAINHQKQKGWVWYFDKQMWQKVIDKNDGYLPLQIKAVEDGTLVKKWEPAMTVTGPSELAAHFEPLLLQLFYKSAIAGDMHFIENIIGEWRVAEFGYRSAQSTVNHHWAVRALYVGWWVTHTSNDAAATAIDQVTSIWTIAHRYLSVRPSEIEAFTTAIEQTDKVALLVDLVDSYKWIDKAIALKEKYLHTDKIISIRLDSWDLADQTVYALNQLKEKWMIDNENHNKIVVEDLSTVDDIIQIEEAVKNAGFDPVKHIIYGSGGLIMAKNKTRDAMSAGYKVINTEDGATGKLSNNPVKEPIPGLPNIEIVANNDGTFNRTVVQESEEVKWERLLKLVYDNGTMLFPEVDDTIALDQARQQVKNSEKWLTPWDLQLSDLTQQIKDEVRTKLRAQAD